MDSNYRSARLSATEPVAGLLTTRRTSEHQHTPDGKTDTSDPSEPVAHRDRLFQKDEAGEAGDPEQVHDAAEEQKAHQEPAAAEAVSAVLEPHAEGSEAAGPPLLSEEAQRRAAVAQT